MKHHSRLLIKTAFFASVLLLCSCSGTRTASAAEIVLIGSTPADSAVRSTLTIPEEKPVDFIRWELTIGQGPAETHPFTLNINYGEVQPNTRGFQRGGEHISLTGECSISKIGNREIFKLKGEKMPSPILLARLNENLFHLVTPEHNLMAGNGGWNYTLTRKGADLSNQLPPFGGLNEPTRQRALFTGRTPCFDQVSHDNLDPGQQCLKIKWKITFFRDAKTGGPATYALQYTLERPNTIQGRWTITKGVKGNPDAVVYNLIREKPAESVSLLAGDENVLFFLDRDQCLLPGTEDFSFTLSRQQTGP
jgi:hypothetical protein